MNDLIDLVIIWGLICTALLVLTPICRFVVGMASAKYMGMTLHEYREYERELEKEEQE